MRTILILLMIIFFSSCNSEPTYVQGEQLYKIHCSSCHMDDGSGLKGVIPPFINIGDRYSEPATLACILTNGKSGVITIDGVEYGAMEMPGVATLKPAEIVNILNYIYHLWGKDKYVLKVEEVEAALNNCEF